MKKVFIRTIYNDGQVECSWYNINGKRYAHRFSNGIATHYGDKTTRETDDKYGYMGYANKHDFVIIDDFVGEHPKCFHQ